MAEAKKGRKVAELKQSTESNSLEAGTKSLESYEKKPGQVGIAAPESIDAIRRPKPEQRVDKGDRVFGGVTEPKVAPQTYDCYNPIREVKPPKKSKKGDQASSES